MEVDYIIVGQGICGTFLSYYLHQSGKKIYVIDESNPFTASKVASGVINPVTGRRIVKTWMIDDIMPFAVESYKELENFFCTTLIKQCNILDFHATPQMEIAFLERLSEETNYLKHTDNPEQWRTFFNYPFGIGEINPCWLIDINKLLDNWRIFLLNQNILLQEKCELEILELYADAVTYKHIHAKKIIFCDGVAGFENPYFKNLPYAQNKGELIIAKIDDLPRTNIFKQGISIVPWKDNLFWIGSSYEWSFDNIHPTENFRKKTETQLKNWLKVPYKIIDHLASVRPANLERRPFAGLHPIHSSMGIFNGMGTKGCSLSPFFAHQFAYHLTQQTPLNPLVDVKRFTKILSR